MFDSKSSVPSLSLREFDNPSIQKTIKQYAENIIQLYNQILDFYLFNPFDSIQFDNDNVFGIVVLFEDSFVSRRLVYEEVQKKLHISDDSIEFTYIKSHVKIVELREIENASFKSYDYTNRMVVQRDDHLKWFDITFLEQESSENSDLIEPISKFFQECSELYRHTVQELVETGIVK